MKTLAYLLLLLTLTAASQIPQHGKWVIDYNSQLMIHGQTNVNTFTCLISCYNSTDTLAYQYNTPERELIFDKNQMIIPIYNFNCGNPLITKDFRKTVKADKNPYLTISFVTLKESDHAKDAGELDISLAGITKRVTLPFIKTKKGDFIQLSGKHSVCFADFKLKAPERMMGLVKVQDDLSVEFNLLIRPIAD